MDNTYLLHSGRLGDIIWSLPAVRSLSLTNPVICLNAGHDEMSVEAATSLLPLLNSQGWLRAELYTNQPIFHDLDHFRSCGLDYRRYDLARQYCFAQPFIDLELESPWLDVEPSSDFKDCIVVNRTERYNNPKVDYNTIRDATGKDIVFVGKASESVKFGWKVQRVPHYEAKDCLELAQWVKGCKMFIGNQSLAFAIADAMKSLRLLEVDPNCSNVMPHGPKGYEFLSNLHLRNLVVTYDSNTQAQPSQKPFRVNK